MRNFLLILLSVIFNTAGQFVMKAGMNQAGRIGLGDGGLVAGFTRAVTTPLVLLGFCLYAASAAAWLVTLSRVNLSWAYPIVSLSYVLIVLLSPLVHERFSLTRLIGTLVILAGVFLVARTPSIDPGS